MSSDRLTFRSYKKEKAENNLKRGQPFTVRQPPKPALVRLSKLAFQLSVLANLALSGSFPLRFAKFFFDFILANFLCW